MSLYGGCHYDTVPMFFRGGEGEKGEDLILSTTPAFDASPLCRGDVTTRPMSAYITRPSSIAFLFVIAANVSQ